MPKLVKKTEAGENSIAPVAENDFISKILDFFSRWCVYLLVFLMPIFFLPQIIDSIYVAKQLLAAVLVLLGVIILVARILFKGETITFIKSKLTFLLILFVAVVALSSFFSGAKYLSFWGFGGSEPFTGLSVALIILFYFLVRGLFADKTFLRRNIFLFSLSATILFSVAVAIAFLVGVFKVEFFVNLFGYPTWNTFGSINALAIFAAASFAFAVGVLFSENTLSKGFKFLLSLQAIFSLFVLLIAGYRNSYLVLIISTLIFIGILFAKFKGALIKKINIPLLILTVFILLFLFNLSFSRFFAVPIEISPGFNLSFEIGWKSMTESVKNFVLGSGPSTFAYDFARYKPDLLNQSDFWNFRFISGFAAIPTLMAELGLLGLLSFVFFFVYKLIILLKKAVVFKKDNSPLLIGAFLGFLVLFISLFIYPLNFVSFFYLMLLLMMALAVARTEEGEVSVFSFDTLPHRALMGALALIGVLIGAAFILFIFLGHFQAEIHYTKGLRALSRGETTPAIGHFQEAIRWYHDDAYYRTTALVIISDAIGQLNREELKQEQVTTIQNNFQLGISYAEQAARINPLERENWFVLGVIYENLIPFVGNAGERAISAYSEVEKLEPMNPIIYLARGRTYLAYSKFLKQTAQNAKEQSGVDSQKIKEVEDKADEFLSKSLEELNKAREKKQNFEAVYLVLARLHEYKGETKEAIDALIAARTINPAGVDSLFNLGRLYYNNKEYDKAMNAMNNILAVAPEHLNAKFILGLVYDAKGEKNKALDIFKELAEAKPDNQEIQKVLNNLKQGLPGVDRSSALPASSAETRDTASIDEAIIEEIGE